MALPQGMFTLAGAGIVSAGGGAYTYASGVNLPLYYGGSFLIDTGYDDPGSFSTGLEAAELYGARVYGVSLAVNASFAAGTYLGRWQIKAMPVWSSKFWYQPDSNIVNQQRVFIECQCWLSEPLTTASPAWFRLESVGWTLYRL